MYVIHVYTYICTYTYNIYIHTHLYICRDSQTHIICILRPRRRRGPKMLADMQPRRGMSNTTLRGAPKALHWEMGCLALELCRRDPSTSLPLPFLSEGGRERPVSLEDLNITTTTTALVKPQCRRCDNFPTLSSASYLSTSSWRGHCFPPSPASAASGRCVRQYGSCFPDSRLRTVRVGGHNTQEACKHNRGWFITELFASRFYTRHLSSYHGLFPPRS